MYLIFDTETTGAPKNWKAPVSDVDNWRRLVQIAWLQYDTSDMDQYIQRLLRLEISIKKMQTLLPRWLK